MNLVRIMIFDMNIVNIVLILFLYKIPDHRDVCLIRYGDNVSSCVQLLTKHFELF